MKFKQPLTEIIIMNHLNLSNILKIFFLILLSIKGINVSAQKLTSDSDLEKEIIKTGLIHSPLNLDDSRSFNNFTRNKKVLYSEILCNMENLGGWSHSGLGAMTHSKDKTVLGNGSLKMEFPTFTGKRAQGSSSDPDYATYGNSRVSFNVNGADWQKYNRIEFYIYPDCEGARVVNLNLSFENDNSQAGVNSASHLVNLVNKQWNRCFLEIDEFRRNNVKRISFSCSIKGKDRTTGDMSVYYIDKIELQQLGDPDIVKGWMPGSDRIVYSTTGYELNGIKTAIVNKSEHNQTKQFQLIDAKNSQSVFAKDIKHEKTTIGEFDIIDFSEFNKSGTYQLKVGNIITPPFQIGDEIWDNSIWRTLNFIFCQRCGYPVPGKHGTCHVDLCAVHDGKTISYGGGWHDAGDLSQQTLQTGDVTFALLEAYNNLKDKNELLAMRLLEEAEWGIDFMLKTRFGDGYRASSVGLLIWQDGIFGTLDDINTVRVHDLAFDNFLYAAYEAFAAMTVHRDPMLQEHLQRIAKEDFQLAMKKHQKSGYGGFIHFYEHSYNTSESQYMATISWAASMLYKLTKDPYYAEIATKYIKYTLECQRKEPLNDKNKTKGFFYRDKSQKSIVHYIHQSREQVYMQAMTLLCETQPNHVDYNKWKESIHLYGDYLKNIMQYTAPFGMIPSGIFHVDEYKDSAAFYSMHLFPPRNAKELYSEQVSKGVQLDKEHYLKRFPVWFSIFNGNSTVHLSMGKAAAICGNFLNDKELLNIGREQLYWTVGKNPFGQSLIYGEGYNYPQLDNFTSGETTGAMPVGIRSWENEDIPYWPQVNNACYKEVWVTSAGKWLTLLSEY